MTGTRGTHNWPTSVTPGYPLRPSARRFKSCLPISKGQSYVRPQFLVARGSSRYSPAQVTAFHPFPGEGVDVRRPSSITCFGLSRPAIVGLIATFVSIALLPSAVAAADSVKTEFEAPLFHLGSVNEQDGWKSATPFDIPSLPHGYDQEVVANGGAPPASFGGQSLRLSNAYNPAPDTSPPEYFFQTYSKPTTEAAGDGLANTEYSAQFSFISTKPDEEQSGLVVKSQP